MELYEHKWNLTAEQPVKIKGSYTERMTEVIKVFECVDGEKLNPSILFQRSVSAGMRLLGWNWYIDIEQGKPITMGNIAIDDAT